MWGLLVAVLTGVVGLFLTRSNEPTSVPAITLLIGEPPAAIDTGQANRTNVFYPWTMITLARVATSEDILKPVAAKHGVQVSALQDRTTARLVTNSLLLEIRYTGTSEADATSTLNDIAAAVIEESKNPAYITTPDAPLKLSVAQPASLNIEPLLTAEADASAASNTSKSTVIRLLIVGGAALALGLLTTIGLAALNRRRGAKE